MNSLRTKLLEYLSSVVTPERLSLYDKIINNRTNYITVVLEDIYQAQNASAVLRTCDCFGIQDIHIIENRNQFQDDKEVSMGSSKWITINKYASMENNSLEAIKTLKKKGYRIIATSPHTNDTELPDFDLKKGKIALIFGSEKPGISKTIEKEADEFLKIPMFGFTESFNISVSAAVILYQLTQKLHGSKSIDWHLTEEEKTEVKIQWIKNNVKKSALIEKRFWEELGLNPSF